MDKIYGSCPPKKRPFYVVEVEKDNDTPVDLSCASKIPRFSDRYTVRVPDHHNTQPRSFGAVKEENDKPLSLETYRQEPLRVYSPNQYNGGGLYGSQYSSDPLDEMSPPSHDSIRECSISPPVSYAGNLDYAQNLSAQHINYNNNVITSGHIDSKYLPLSLTKSEMLSPTASNASSFISNKSDSTTSYFEPEPEDLSVRGVRKLMILSDSNANIQRFPKGSSAIAARPASDLYYQCHNCSKCYSTYAGLVKHQQCHHSVTSGVRGRAPRVSYTQEQYQSHTHMQTPPNPVSSSTSNCNNLPAPTRDKQQHNIPRYQCRDCNKSYSTYSGLNKHQQFHCPAAEGNQTKKFFSCKNCDKVYVSLGALKMHIRTHTLPCKCPLCGKAFSRPWLLQGHIRTHTGEKPFTCQHCKRAFADRSNLRAHLQTHSDVKKYSCTCSKTFSRMSLLTKHLQAGCPGALEGSNLDRSRHHSNPRMNDDDFPTEEKYRYHPDNEVSFNHPADNYYKEEYSMY